MIQMLTELLCIEHKKEILHQNQSMVQYGYLILEQASFTLKWFIQVHGQGKND